MNSLLASVPENDPKVSSRAGNAAGSNAASPWESSTFRGTRKINSSRGKHTQADEANVPGSRHILRRRGSHLKRWIEDQHYHAHTGPNDGLDASDDADPSAPTIGTPCNPYLAYPHLGVSSFQPRTLNEVGSLHNYVVVDEVADDGAEVEDHVSMDSEGAEHMSLPPSPALNASPQTMSSSNIHNPSSSFRSFSLFRSSRAPAIPVSGASSTSRNSSRLSLFRSPRQSTSTLRSASYKSNESFSFSTLNLPPTAIPPDSGSARGTTSDTPTWRWKLGHFSSTSTAPRAHESPAPRVSTSSTYTYTSAISSPTTIYENEGGELLSTQPKVYARGRVPPRNALFKSGSGTTSVPSLWSSERAPVSHTQEISGSTPRSRLVHKGSAIRIPFSPKNKHVRLSSTSTTNDVSPLVESEPQIPHIVYPNGKSRLSLSSLSVPTREKRKKKLIVSGIESHDLRRFEALRAWCESFGEVTQIVRVANGDLHVHFRKAEVAETVCRVRAKVNIPGVGSVYMSWFTGDKR